MQCVNRLRFGIVLATCALFLAPLEAQVRTEIALPAMPPYTIVRCDFHTHTVFSDGNVWPTVRVQEAWLQELDAIAITDHVEYTPHKDDVKVDLNRSYELAKDYAKLADRRAIAESSACR